MNSSHLDEHGHPIAEPTQVQPVQRHTPDQRQRISIGTLNVFTGPARRWVADPLRRRYDEHYHPRHRFGPLHLILDIAAVAIVAALVLYNGYLYLATPKTATLPITLAATLEPNPPTTAGSSTIRVHFTYNGNVPSANTSIQLTLPQTYEITRAIPQEGFDGKQVRWNLGELAPDTSGDVVLEGIYWGIPSRPDEVLITAVGTLATANGASTSRQQRTKMLLSARQPAIETRVELPSTVVLSQPTTVAVTLTNTNDRSIIGLVLIPTAPSTWTTTEARPALEENRWKVGNLGARSSKTFTLKGLYARLPTSPSFFFRLERVEEGANREISITRMDTTIADPALELTARIDSPEGATNPADRVQATITYRNRGEFPLEQVVISAQPSGDYVDPTSIEATEGNVESGRAIWNPQNVKTLSQLVPDQGGEVHLSFRLKRSIPLIDRSPLEDFLLTITPRASFRVPILPNQTVQWTGATAVEKINSALGVLAQTRYWTAEGEQIGRGPLPPRVGAITRYWVTVNVSNTIHDLYETKVTIPLAPSVQWTGRSSVSAGPPLQFDKATQSFIWSIGRLDHFLGSRAPEVTAAIELAVTPAIEDRGHMMILLEETSASGIDAITKTKLSATAAGVTTELSKDQRGGGKGVVQ